MTTPIHYSATMPIRPVTQPPNGTALIPGSKSLTNRALILAALANGTSTLEGALFSEDTDVMAESLRRLGVDVMADAEEETFVVQGQGGRLPAQKADLFVANSGTSIRFLTALTALGSGEYRLDGIERMQQRPQQDLLDALVELGVSARSERDNGCPPLLVETQDGLPGGEARVGAEASSQYLTALLMVAPYAHNEVTLDVFGALRPFYVDITRRMMAQWGVELQLEAGEPHGGRSVPVRYRVPVGQRYTAQQPYRIEPDASSASYFFAAAAVTGGRVTVPGLRAEALQGDVRFALEVLAEMGCQVTSNADGITVVGPPPGQLRGIERDMSAISDTSLTLAAIAPFANSPTIVHNIAHSRLQECDRISAACTELTRLGVSVEERPDGFTVYPTQTLRPTEIETYNDHRVAMSFALTGLRTPGIVIRNPACVAKTFPDFWQRFERLY